MILMTGMVCTMTNNEMTGMAKMIGITGMIWMTGMVCMIRMNMISGQQVGAHDG